MINYEQEVKKVYPDAKLRWWPRSETYTIEHNGLTIYGSQHIYSDHSWKSAYETLKQQGKL